MVGRARRQARKMRVWEPARQMRARKCARAVCARAVNRRNARARAKTRAKGAAKANPERKGRAKRARGNERRQRNPVRCG